MINLSYNFSNQERQQVKLGLHYCFVDEDKDVQRFLAANMESLADSIKATSIIKKNLKIFMNSCVATKIFLTITFMLQKIIYLS